MKGYRYAGVYVFRTRRPGILGLIPAWVVPVGVLLGIWMNTLAGYSWWLALPFLLLSSRHFAYVGETRNVALRKRDHLEGSVKYNALPKPWGDLSPTHYFLPLPGAPKFVLRSVETLLILLLWPVYNHQKNLWNPRRIPLRTARRQAILRAGIGWSFNLRPAHAILWVAVIGFALQNGWFS